MDWEWLDDNRVLKKCEYSDFTNFEMRVPERMEAFFSGNGDRLEFSFNDREYPIYIRREASVLELIWSKVLIRKLAEAFPEYESFFEAEQTQIPGLLFVKKDDKILLSLIREDNLEQIEQYPEVKHDNRAVGPIGQGLSKKLKEWVSEYPNYYPRDFRFSFKEVIQTEIPDILGTIPNVLAGDYQLQGFAGETEWAEIPWVSAMKKDASGSGLSVVYCLAKDSQILYLAILYKEEGAGVGSLAEKVNEFREMVTDQSFKTLRNEIYLADPLLVSGFVYYQAYEDGLPDDAELVSDYSKMISLYERIINDRNRAPESIEGKQNEELISQDDKSGYQFNDDQSVIIDGEKEELKKASENQPLETIDVEKVDVGDFASEEQAEEVLAPQLDNGYQKDTQLEALERPELAPLEPAFYAPEIREPVLKTATEQTAPQHGSEAIIDQDKKNVKLQNGLDQQLERLINLPLKQKKVKELNMPQHLKLVMDKMGSRGFYYPEEFIVNYYLSLKAKPFLILKGRSGTGKTSFPRLFAESIGASYENGRFERILVAKSWEDEKQIFRSFDSRGSFIASPIAKMIRKAMDDPGMPHFLLLDEMDQAKDMDCYRLLLEGLNGRDEPLLEREDFASDNSAYREYGSLVFPDNLYIVGTLKNQAKDIAALLDSGNLIEMPEVEINAFPANGDISQDGVWNHQQFKMNNPISTLPEIIENLMRCMTTIQNFLLKHRAGMGYRQKNEILAYGINSGIEGLFSEDESIDRALVQRLLPWIEIQNLTNERFYRELLFLALEGESFEDQMIKEAMLTLSTEAFGQIVRKWQDRNYFTWPLTADFLIKRIGN
jgi:hypothetical protein